MDRTVLVFDQEVYNQFRYKAPRPYFHTFEGDDAQIGLNFADESEAEFFQQTVESKLNERRNRRERRQASRKQQGANTGHSNGAAKHGMSNGGAGEGGVKGVGAPLQTMQINRRDQGGQGVKKGDKKKLTKHDIGMPTNFQHISHVGWDPNHGFDLENVDPNLKKFFQRAGVDEAALLDHDTREFIYDFIDKHGGVEAALREVNNQPDSMMGALSSAPPPPPRSAQPTSRPPPPSRVQATAPPPPPSQRPSTQPIQKAPPPPPPPPPQNAPPSSGHNSLMDQMRDKVSLRTAPPPAPSLPPIPDAQNDLMEQIRDRGKNSLRHVSPEKTRPPVDVRTDLMGQIRQGLALKPVETDNSSNNSGDVASQSGLAGALQRALLERHRDMGHSSSEESEGDDDEWDDEEESLSVIH